MRDAGSPTPVPPNRDADTAARLVAGDPDGLRQLFEDHGGLLRARLEQVFGTALDDSELDEVLAMTSVRVWRAARRFDPAQGSLRGWVAVIGRRCALSLLQARARARRNEQPVDVHELAELPPPSPVSPHKQRLLADMLACLEHLPPLQRAVLLADYQAGGPAPAHELAKRLRTSINSIYVSRHKGRQSLRKALEGLGHGTNALDDDAAREAETT